LLRGGPLPSEQVYEKAEAVGIARRTLERAKASLGVVSEPHSGTDSKRWCWRLRVVRPDDEPLSYPEQRDRALAHAKQNNEDFRERIQHTYVYEPVGKAGNAQQGTDA
jgi:hypothetical protein